jgi:hypothetical protein
VFSEPSDGRVKLESNHEELEMPLTVGEPLSEDARAAHLSPVSVALLERSLSGFILVAVRDEGLVAHGNEEKWRRPSGRSPSRWRLLLS